MVRPMSKLLAANPNQDRAVALVTGAGDRIGIGVWGGIGGGLSQLYGGMGGGLYHTPPDLIERQLIEARANDPFRITQTFPFVVS